MKLRTTSRAFTLIELLLVLVILAVLAAVVIPKMTGRVEDSKRKATIASISSLKQALDAFEIDNGHYPQTNDGLDALVVAPADCPGWQHKYIDEVPVDAWNTPFQYKGPDQVAAGEDYDIISAGPNANFGDNDDIDKYTKAQ